MKNLNKLLRQANNDLLMFIKNNKDMPTKQRNKLKLLLRNNIDMSIEHNLDNPNKQIVNLFEDNMDNMVSTDLINSEEYKRIYNKIFSINCFIWVKYILF